MKIKKIVLILLAVVMLLSFTACTGENESSGKNIAESSQSDTNEDSTSDTSSAGSEPDSKPKDSKILVAFCTSADSGFCSSDSALKSAAGEATWLDGHRFSADVSAEDVLAWANELEIN